MADTLANVREITVQPTPTPFIVPPHIGGDAEYGGHGPAWYARIELQIQNDIEIVAIVYADAIETRHNWTHVRGTSYHQVYRHRGRIYEIASPRVGDFRYTDTDHDRDVFSFPPSAPFTRLEFVGDTRGPEAGTRTGVQVFFHPIRLIVAA